MKRYIKCNEDDWDMSYCPELSQTDVDEIIETLVEEVTQKFQKRYKDISVDIDNTKWTPSKLETDILIYNKEKCVKTCTFSYTLYNCYFDHEDYCAQINRAVHQFVNSISKR